MTQRERLAAEIARLRPRAMRGDGSACSNIAVNYRLLGRPRLAFRWWCRGASAADGDDFLEVGFCYHHGLGVRRNLSSAASAYASAVRSASITQFGCEEAMYHWATLLLEKGGPRAHSHAASLLRRANADQDYRQARELLNALESGDQLRICSCRRGLKSSIRRVACRVHR